jgi:hypothetical protein
LFHNNQPNKRRKTKSHFEKKGGGGRFYAEFGLTIFRRDPIKATCITSCCAAYQNEIKTNDYRTYDVVALYDSGSDYITTHRFWVYLFLVILFLFFKDLFLKMVVEGEEEERRKGTFLI